jgi:hypothetical protein
MIAPQNKNKNTDYLLVNPINPRIIDCNLTGYNQEQVAQFIASLTNAHVVDASPMASGKTQLGAKLARITNRESLLAMAHRVSLIHGLANTLELTHYQSASPNEYLNNLAVCLNSIVTWQASKGFETVVVDEFRQNLETLLTASTIKNKRAIFQEFKAVLNNCNLSLCLDADFNDFCLNFLLKHTDKKIYRIHRDNYTVIEKEIIELRSHAVIRERCIDHYYQNETAMIAVSSIKEGDKFVRYLIEKGVKRHEILYKNSDTKVDAVIRAFDKNPNEEIKKYKFFIYTPAITSGVSLIEPHFNHHYACFSRVLQSNENLQMIARDRTAKTIYCSFAKDEHIKKPTDVTRLIDGSIKQRMRLNFNLTDDGTIKIEADEIQLDELELLQLQLAIQYNEDLNNYRENFFTHAEKNHYKVTRYDPNLDTSKQDEEKLQEGLSQRTLEERVEQIIDSKIIDETQAKVYEEADKFTGLTKIQKDELNRHKVTQMAGTPEIVDYDVERYLKGDLKVVLRQESLSHSDMNLVSKDKQEWANNGQFVSSFGLAKIMNELLALLESKEINNELARMAIGLLAQHADELIANGFSDYRHKSSAERPLRTLRNFLARFGYCLGKPKHKRMGEQRERVYLLAKIEYIEQCVERRANLATLGNANGNFSLRNKNTVTVPNQQKETLADKITRLVGISTSPYDDFEFAT